MQKRKTPTEIKREFQSLVGELMTEGSFTLMLNVNKEKGLSLTTAAVNYELDFVALGKLLYEYMEANEDLGNKFASILSGINERLMEEEGETQKLMVNISPSRTLS